MAILHQVGIGMIISFLFTELVGLSPGGIVVPGYLALFWDSPHRLSVTILIALLTLGIVKLISRHLIVFGRRRFMLSVLIGYMLGWLLFTLSPFLPVEADLRVIGHVVPGLIANDMNRQGIIKTILSVLIASLLIHLLLLVLM